MRLFGYYLVLLAVLAWLALILYLIPRTPTFIKTLENFCGGSVLYYNVLQNTPEVYVIKFRCFSDKNSEFVAYIPKKGGNDGAK
jgi:hypothetical protein